MDFNESGAESGAEFVQSPYRLRLNSAPDSGADFTRTPYGLFIFARYRVYSSKIDDKFGTKGKIISSLS